MLKVANTEVVMIEVPDEISLALNLSHCPNFCKGCHSEYLLKDIGIELTHDYLDSLIKDNAGISCISFMGGDRNPLEVLDLCKYVKNAHDLKTCWYSGKQELPDSVKQNSHLLLNLDYLKLGPWIESKGPLSSVGTNQIFYKLYHEGDVTRFEDITHRFRNLG